jgi:hypothetical protein
MSRTITVLIALMTALCAAAVEHGDDTQLAQLAGWMEGSFSSEAQSVEDPDFFHIVLRMARIWSDRTDGYWFYVEQAAAETADRPYRQRVYHVRRVGEDLFASSVYSFSSPIERAGAWRLDEPLADLSHSQITEREGCTIYLKQRPDGVFEGSTLGRLCTSTLRGASWASSEVVITSDSLTSWDRGWDDAGSQVWGAEKAGYRFDRTDGNGLDAE